jgi:hypothetical protein
MSTIVVDIDNTKGGVVIDGLPTPPRKKPRKTFE